MIRITGAFVLAFACVISAIGCGGKTTGASNSGSTSAASTSTASTQTTASVSQGTNSNAGSPSAITLAAATSNNTSASDNFAGTSNGNPKPANISKISVHQLLYPGATTKIYVHVMPWWGTTSHANIGYNSADPAQAKKQVTDMVSRGVDGLIVDWYGPTNTPLNNATLALSKEAEQHSGFEFAICEDVGALSGDVTSKIISDINYIYTNFVQSPNYMRKNGRPIIALFGEENSAIDWTTVAASVQGNPMFIWRDNGGFTRPQSSGSFTWVGITGNASDPGLAYLDSFYQTAIAAAPKQTFGSGYKGFDDSIASWGSHRKINQNCGQTWIQTFADISKHYSTSNQLESIQIPTWNDYEEGTEIETGIDNCVSVAASLSGQTLSWSISGGQENTIDHYTIFVSSDGQNLTPLTDTQTGNYSMNMSGYNLPSGTYTLYVQAVGKPSIMNHMSGPVKLTL